MFNSQARESQQLKLSKISQTVALTLAAAYLVFRPEGSLGIVITSIALALGLIGQCVAALGVSALLFGPPLLGIAARLLGMQAIGAPIALLLGGTLTLLSWKQQPHRYYHTSVLPYAWMTASIILMILAYEHGPQTEYAASKLTYFSTGLVVGVIAIVAIACDNSISGLELAQTACLSAISYLSLLSFEDPSFANASVLTFGRLRMNELGTPLTGVLFGGPRTIAQFAGWGAAFLIGAVITSRRNQKHPPAQILLLFIASAILLLASGQRAPFFAIALSLTCLWTFRKNVRKGAYLAGGVATLLVALVALDGIGTNNPLLTQVADDQSDWMRRANRDANWNAAVNRIREEPITGHGLGNYYIDNYRGQATAMYAHNVVLELWAETGIITTVVIALPPLLALTGFRKRKGQDNMTAVKVVPFLLYGIVMSNVTGDLAETGLVVGALGGWWLYNTLKERKIKRLHLSRHSVVRASYGSSQRC